jgi:enoyl-CoA hydratase/carnithine racemase
MSALPVAQLLSARVDVPSCDKQVLCLTLSNPGSRNALHPDIYRDAMEIFGALSLEAEGNKRIAAVILQGADGVFCAGGNLNRLKSNRDKPKQVQHDSIAQLNAWILAIRSCPLPVIAAVSGAAAGAGFSLALACDMVVADTDAKFVMAYVKVGLSPDGGATYALSQRLPAPLAFELCALGQAVSAERLYQFGLVNRLSAKGEAGEVALALASDLARGPSNTITSIKRLLSLHERAQLQTTLDAEREAFVSNLHGPEAAIGIDAFLNKQAPSFP